MRKISKKFYFELKKQKLNDKELCEVLEEILILALGGFEYEHCQHCGALLEEDALYCSNCGNKITN